MTSERLFELGVQAICFSSLWILLVLILRVPVSRWLGARWSYALWMVPAISLAAMMIPAGSVQQVLTVPDLQLPIMNQIAGSASEWVGHIELRAGYGPSYSVINPAVSVSELLLATWLLGVLVSVLINTTRIRHAHSTVRLLSHRLSNSERATVIHRCSALASRKKLSMRMLHSTQGPAVTGVFRSTLLLPAGFFDRFSILQQVLILQHESTHLDRHDPLMLMLVRGYCCLFWFNPLVYMAEHFLRLDQELSCDEHVLGNKNSATRRVYGETLLTVTQHQFVTAFASYFPTFRQLRKRTIMLRHYQRSLLASLTGLAVLLASIGSSVTFGVLGLDRPVKEIRPELLATLEQPLSVLSLEEVGTSALQQLLSSLHQLDSASERDAFSVNEVAHVRSMIAYTYFRLEDYERSLHSYGQVVTPTNVLPELKSRAFESMAEIYHFQERHVEAVMALVQSEKLGEMPHTPDSHALRSASFVKLKQWEQGLNQISRAISQTELRGKLPPADWLFTQSALRLQLGDLDGASHSLDKCFALYPDASFESKLSAFNKVIQESYEPAVKGELLLAQQ